MRDIWHRSNGTFANPMRDKWVRDIDGTSAGHAPTRARARPPLRGGCPAAWKCAAGRDIGTRDIEHGTGHTRPLGGPGHPVPPNGVTSPRTERSAHAELLRAAESRPQRRYPADRDRCERIVAPIALPLLVLAGVAAGSLLAWVVR